MIAVGSDEKGESPPARWFKSNRFTFLFFLFFHKSKSNLAGSFFI